MCIRVYPCVSVCNFVCILRLAAEGWDVRVYFVCIFVRVYPRAPCVTSSVCIRVYLCVSVFIFHFSVCIRVYRLPCVSVCIFGRVYPCVCFCCQLGRNLYENLFGRSQCGKNFHGSLCGRKDFIKEFFAKSMLATELLRRVPNWKQKTNRIWPWIGKLLWLQSEMSEIPLQMVYKINWRS